MNNITISIDHIEGIVSKAEVYEFSDEIKQHFQSLTGKTGKGNDFLGWVDLPDQLDEAFLTSIQESAVKLASLSDIIVVIGIGGSYLGARAVIDALNHQFASLLQGEKPLVLYAGQNIGEDYLTELLEVLDQKDYSIVVISKSGTTTEPAIAFAS